MRNIIELSREMAQKYTCRDVLIASLGDGAKVAAQVFGTDHYTIHAIGNPNDKKDAAVAENVKELREMGIKVHLLPHSLFQAISKGEKYKIGEEFYSFSGYDFCGLTISEIIAKAKQDAYCGVFQVIYQTLQSLFSDGPRMCIEIALMAADAGIIPTDRNVVCIDRPLPQSNCPHSAMVLRPSKSMDFLKHSSFRVKEIITVPGWKDKWFTDGPIWSD